MRYRALLRVILLVWIHISLVSATLNHHQAKEFTELARLFVAESHHQIKNNRSLAHKLVLERFLKQAAVILGITFTAFTLEKIKIAFRYQVRRVINPDYETAKSKRNNANTNAKFNPINKENGNRKKTNDINNAITKETARVRRVETLLNNPDLARHVLTKEEIAAQCEEWLNSTHPRLVGRNGEQLTWRQAILSGLYAIYFGTTMCTIEQEWLRFLCHATVEDGGNRPILLRMNGKHFTAKQAVDELDFFHVQIGVGDVLNHNCRAKENYMQAHQTYATADYDEGGVLHRRLGQQLHRQIGKGSNKEKENRIFRLFASVAPITKHHFDERPIDDNRSTIWVNGIQCLVDY